MTASVFEMDVFQDISLNEAKDEVSLNLGSQNGVDYCGDRQYFITTLPMSLYNDFLGLRNKKLTVFSASSDDIGVHTI